MSQITTEFRNWNRDQALGNDTGVIDTVAIGSGSATPSSADTTLASEVYRADVSQANCSILATEQDGVANAEVIVSGGTEVDTNQTIAEIGVFATGTDGDGDVLVGRDTGGSVTVGSGETEKFSISLDF